VRGRVVIQFQQNGSQFVRHGKRRKLLHAGRETDFSGCAQDSFAIDTRRRLAAHTHDDQSGGSAVLARIAFDIGSQLRFHLRSHSTAIQYMCRHALLPTTAVTCSPPASTCSSALVSRASCWCAWSTFFI